MEIRTIVEKKERKFHFLNKNQIIFAEPRMFLFLNGFWYKSIPTLPPIMSLKCILDEYFYFELSHWFPYLLFLDLALQILANLSLGVLIKFVLIKKKSVFQLFYWDFFEFLCHLCLINCIHSFRYCCYFPLTHKKSSSYRKKMAEGG